MEYDGVGIIADTIDYVSRAYSTALCAKNVFRLDTMRDWRELYVWARHGISTILTLTDGANSYLEYVGDKYNLPLIGIRFREWKTVCDYNAIIEAWEVGWGVDKERFALIVSNRRPKPKPTYHLLSHDEAIDSRLKELGRTVRYGTNYYLGDVALEPSSVTVPVAMYNAAASGMPVISTRENELWTRVFGVYEDLFLDDSIDKVVAEVEQSDFLYAGMVASDVVPSWWDFRVKLRELLNSLSFD
jgi:hypothetical protein